MKIIAKKSLKNKALKSVVMKPLGFTTLGDHNYQVVGGK
ncbi:hypothetical protein SAMN02745866_00297 [Alteromonadaceae bacterium Bs31]|nr:hypothetical protein SAMN02745866_00297 [Alteromonadaceae bacterium Bs31]